MKVGIIVIVYNLHPEIFILQMQALRKFCKDKDYTIEVVDNSENLAMAESIRYHAKEQGVNYYKTFASTNNGSDSHAWACNFAYQKFKDTYEGYAFIDHDCIAIKEFSIEEILKDGHAMAGLGQGSKKTYFWAGMVMWIENRVDSELIDFSVSHSFGLDTGGNLYKVVEKYGKENCIFFNEKYYQNPFYNGLSYSHYATINDDMFLHLVASSNWSKEDRHEERINSLINIAKEKTGL